MIKAYAEWILRWRYLMVFGVLTLLAVAAVGGRYLGFKNDYRMFFSEDNPQLMAFEDLQATYTKNDNVLFVIAPRGGNVFTTEVLAAVEKLTQEAWQIPYSTRVDSMTNFQHSYAKGDELVVDDLVRSAERLGPAQLERIRDIATREPLLVNRLVSPAGDVTGINVVVQLPGIDEAREVPEVAAFARQLAAQTRAENPDLDVYVTGLVMMNSAFPESSERDMKTLVPLMLLAVVAMIGFLLRAVSGTFVTLLVIILSIVGAMGLAGWLGITLSPTSAIAPNIILTLAVAYCVHVLTSFTQAMGTGMDKQAAMVESLRLNLQPVFLAGLTTAVGFLSMNFSDAPPFHDLGNITALGVVIAFILSVVFLPALMVILPVRVDRRPRGTGRAMEWLAEVVIRRRSMLFWGMATAIGVLVVFIPKNELNDEYVKYFDKDVEFRQATDFATDRLTGIYYIDYSLEAGKPDGVVDPTFLAKVEEFSDWYREQPGVLHVNSITDIIKRLNKNMHGDAPAYYRLPERADLTAQYLLLYELSLPYGLDLNDRINVDKSAVRLTVTLESLSSQEVLALEERAQAWLAANASPTMRTPGSGPTIMFAHIGQRNITSMLLGVVVALVLISFILIFALRSVKLGLVSLVPNLVPVAMGFGLWGLVVGQVGLALSVVGAMTLGVVVDDTVHFLSKYLRARKEKGLNAHDAVRYAFSTAGTAIWATSVVLMLGFAILAFSSFEINSGMGLLTAIVIGLALAADLLFLPPLLMKIEEKRHEENAVAVTVAGSHVS